MKISDGTTTVELPLSERYEWVEWQGWHAIFRFRYEIPPEVYQIYDWMYASESVSVDGGATSKIIEMASETYQLDPMAVYVKLRFGGMK